MEATWLGCVRAPASQLAVAMPGLGHAHVVLGEHRTRHALVARAAVAVLLAPAVAGDRAARVARAQPPVEQRVVQRGGEQRGGVVLRARLQERVKVGAQRVAQRAGRREQPVGRVRPVRACLVLAQAHLHNLLQQVRAAHGDGAAAAAVRRELHRHHLPPAVHRHGRVALHHKAQVDGERGAALGGGHHRAHVLHPVRKVLRGDGQRVRHVLRAAPHAVQPVAPARRARHAVGPPHAHAVLVTLAPAVLA
mmetsp:Transcript_15308/g.38161  ORF Transcript_15308/g.38161 Transcript_15308/m.38161 type:complete len:250 (-) Transcript_15308:566-1315(-)